MARDFDGVDDAIVKTGMTGLTGNDFTIILRFKTSDVTTNQCLLQLASGNSSGLARINFSFISGKIDFTGSFNTTNGQWQSGVVFSTNTYYTVAIMYSHSATTTDPTFYVGQTKYTVGSGITEVLTPVGTLKNATNDTIRIGTTVAGTLDYSGLIAHVEVFNRILGEGEYFQALYYPGSIVGSKFLYWPLFGFASPEPDYSGRGYSGTVTGAIASTDNPPINGIYIPRRSELSYAAIAASGGGTTISMPAGSLVLSGLAPTVLTPRTVAVPAGSLSLTGLVPIISNPKTLFPDAGSLVLNAYAPKVTDGTTPAATTRSLLTLGVG